MSKVQIKVGQTEYTLEQDVAFQSAYIKNIYTDTNPEQALVIDKVTEEAFAEVVCLLKNKEYPFPLPYQEVLDFLGVEYSNKNLYATYQQKCSSLACTRILFVRSSLHDYCNGLSRQATSPLH